jgi:hypothetical protein
MARQWVLKNAGASEGLLIELSDSGDISFKLYSDETAVAALIGGSTLIADLTENSGAIGGTNDGDLPDLTTPSAALNTAAVRELAVRINEIQAELRTMGVLGTS